VLSFAPPPSLDAAMILELVALLQDASGGTMVPARPPRQPGCILPTKANFNERAWGTAGSLDTGAEAQASSPNDVVR
jgi:hypothetical protein